MKTNIYIDGFNLYYGLFNNRKRQLPWKWLDLQSLATRLLPQRMTLNRIRYFTADVVERPNDPDQPARQQIYLRALSTIPSLSIHKGNFLTSRKKVRATQPIPVPQTNPRIRGECVSEVRRALRAIQTVETWSIEEKGSDVNLASYLMYDAATGDCDAAMVVSNDSDLATPLRLAKVTWGTTIIVVNPHPNHPTALLRQLADEIRRVRPKVVRECRFPNAIKDSRGRTIRKPDRWARDEARYLQRMGEQILPTDDT
jgi:hypothetical protein